MPIESHRVPLGARLPWFDLCDLGGARWNPRVLPPERPILVCFLCNHSPYVRHIEMKLADLLDQWSDSELVAIAISPNDPEAYPDDSVPFMEEQVRRSHLAIPYLFDERQAAARAFQASCTPDFFLYSERRRLAYHGEFDSSRGESEATGRSLAAAVDAVLTGRSVHPIQVPSLGCSVKWKAGNEPAYLSI